MAKFFAMQIRLRKITIKDVPKEYQEETQKALKKYGW